MSSQISALDGAPGASRLQRLLDRFSGLLSLRYFMLRCFTAAGAVCSGLAQTFVFARVLTPRDFSIYILIGSFGAALWMFDLGASKILFVRQRARHLGQRADEDVAAQSNAIIALYALAVIAGGLLCFVVMASAPSVTAGHAMQFAAFFTFVTFNLVWFPLRNISVAVDDFIGFEVLEAVRRIVHLGLMLLMLGGLSLAAFLSLANVFWFVLFAACIPRLVRRGALAPHLHGMYGTFKRFWRNNRAELLGSANYSIGDLAIYNFPYVVVPMIYGLAAPTIILDTVFKIFRGATLIYSAGLDPLLPRQTRAFAERDMATLKRATWTAAVLCAIPTLILCAALIVAGDRIFALLLGHAASVPAAATPILIVLLIANLAQSVASCLLLHTGFFRELARAVTATLGAMAVVTLITVAAGAGIVGFMGGYAAAYIVGAVIYIVYLMQKIFRRY